MSDYWLWAVLIVTWIVLAATWVLLFQTWRIQNGVRQRLAELERE